MQKLKSSEISQHRASKLTEQGGRCALCMDPIEHGDAVLDHDHRTGYCRGVLHSGCNSMLGHIENNRPRYRMLGARLMRWALSIFAYIHKDYSDQPVHPLHKTEDEKRLLKNKRARVARAKKATL